MKKIYLFASLILANFCYSQDFIQNTVDLLPNTTATSLIVEDLDNDGNLDVLINGVSGVLEISAWFGDGNGNFGNKVIIDNSQVNAGSQGRDVTVLDVNNDGYLDIVASVAISFALVDHKVVWYPNNQDGTFGSRVVIGEGGWTSDHIVILDVDNNGFDDIILNSRASDGTNNHSLDYFPNNGDGTFGTKINITNDGELRGLASGFFNNDSFEDLVYNISFDSEVKILINNGDGTFTGPTVINNTLTSANYLSVGKINNDSFDDVLVSEFNQPETLSYFAGNGDGTFGPKVVISGGQFNQIINSAISDIDNDGDNDIVSAVQVQSDFVWFENGGEGNFGSPNSISTSSSTNQDVAIADINENGKKDIIVTNQDGVFWYENNLVLSTSDYSLNKDVKIGPNPTDGMITIISQNIQVKKIELFDSTGRNIEFKEENQGFINMTNYSSGVYFMKIYTDKGITTRKILRM